MKRFLGFIFVVLTFVYSVSAADKKIVLVAGKMSHGAGAHEFNAGVQLLKKCLDTVPGVKTEVHLNGWPENDSVLDGADGIVLFMDGGKNHPLLQGVRLDKMGERMKKGVGLGCIHYAVEPTIDWGQKEFLDWIGGAFEINWSVNPHWEADFTKLPDHPVTRGVKPFKINDEWYFHMRFRDKMKDVTPILSAIAPDETMNRGEGSHQGNPHVREAVRKREPQHVMWVTERKDGGRGFGFTGGHFHSNWGNEDFRKVVLNSILWIAKADVPKNGVDHKLSAEELQQNLDPKGEKKKKAKINPPPADPETKPEPTPAAAPAPEEKAAQKAPVRPKYKSGLVIAGRVPIDVDISGAKKLWLVVTDGGNGFEFDWSDWVEPKLVRPDGSTFNLTELKWKTGTTGYGEIAVDSNLEGNPLKIEKRVFTNGFGVHAPSMLEFELPESFSRFQAKAGIDVGGSDQGGSSVEFLVFTEPPPSDVFDAKPPATADGKTHGIEAAREAINYMTVADGLEVSLFASEPMLKNPTDIDIDARGRVWVAQAVNYRSTFKPWGTLDPTGDKILILEDTNGDGVADVSKVFYEGEDINSVLGVCVLGNKVIVSKSPNIFVLTDTDGDDKADKKEVLFTGMSGNDHDHGVHAMVFGPDGKLYFNFGNEGMELRRADSTIVTGADGEKIVPREGPYRQGMTFRCNIDGGDVEVLGHNFRNPYECAVDSFGTVWQSDNDDDGNRGVRINYVMEHGNYGYTGELTGSGWGQKRTNLEEEVPKRHWHLNDPGVVPNLLLTGAGAPTGITIYEGKLLPKIFHNQIIHCDAGPRVVRSYPAQPDGAGYKAEMVDIVSSGDSWFRPADVGVAPDGSLYIADWNDAGVGGHNMADHKAPEMKGRIYRVAPKGHKPVLPKYDLTTSAGCVEALQSPNNATRYLAWTKLHEMQETAEKDLLKLWNGEDERMRARGLHLLARIKGKEQTYIEQALRDKNSDIRITGLRIAKSLKLDLIPVVKKLVEDSSPQVRRECALVLRVNISSEAPKLWAQLAMQHDGKDRWYLEALGIGAQKNETAFFDAWLKLVGNKWNTPAGRDIIWRSRSPKAASYLAEIIRDPGTPEKDRSRYFRALDFIQGAEKELALIQLLNAATPENN